METLGTAPFQQLLHERCCPSHDLLKVILEALLRLVRHKLADLKMDLHMDGGGGDDLSTQEMARKVVSKTDTIKQIALQICVALHCLRLWLTDQRFVRTRTRTRNPNSNP